MSELEKRVIELEIKISHQEHTIEQLNQLIIEHQNSMDMLLQQQKMLRQQIVSLQEANEKEPADPPPPHY